MGTDEQILRSFLADDEELLGTWQVGTVGSGFHRPSIGPTAEETVAATDRRLLWFDEELKSVRRADITGVDRDAVERSTAPRVVRIGGAALAVGVLGSVAAFLFARLAITAVLAPAALGLAAFVATFALAQVRGLSGSERRFPYLQVHTADGVVTVWGDDDELAAVEAALAGE